MALLFTWGKMSNLHKDPNMAKDNIIQLANPTKCNESFQQYWNIIIQYTRSRFQEANI